MKFIQPLFASFALAVLCPCGPLVSATHAQAPATQAAGDDTDWPQTASADGTTFTLNAPSYTAITGNSVTMRLVVQAVRGTAAPSSGTIELVAAIAPSDAPGMVELNNFTINSCSFADGSGDAAKATLTKLLDGMGIDAKLATIVQGVAVGATREVGGLSNAVPTITVVERPTMLVLINGAPQTTPIGTNGWKRTTNTPYVVLQSPGGAWYIQLGESSWMTSPSIDGSFVATTQAPPAEVTVMFGKPPAAPHTASAPTGAATTAPDVLVSTRPMVLISINGAPVMETVAPGVDHVKNTSGVVLKQGGSWWVLASGRWFNAPSLRGAQWTYVSAKGIPAAFAQIPSSGKLASVRASVPATTEANEAAVTSNLVRTVSLERSSAKCGVRFQGPAQFAKVQGADVEWATNASQPVLRTGGSVYCCDLGAWFSANDAKGPWALCDSVPVAIYSMTPSCPVYPATFVEVLSSSATEVTFGATVGYYGTFMQDGVPVHGTGFDYNASNPQMVSAPPQDGNPMYVDQAYPQTYGNQNQYSSTDGTYVPVDDSTYYNYYPAVQPSVMYDGYGGWGYPMGYGYGYGMGGWGYGWGDGYRGYGYGGYGERNFARGYARGYHRANNGGIGDRGIGDRGIGGAGRAGGVGGVGGAGRAGGVGGIGDRGAGGAGGAGGWNRGGGMNNRGGGNDFRGNGSSGFRQAQHSQPNRGGGGRSGGGRR